MDGAEADVPRNVTSNNSVPYYFEFLLRFCDVHAETQLPSMTMGRKEF
jgi:hypothetical protein